MGPHMSRCLAVPTYVTPEGVKYFAYERGRTGMHRPPPLKSSAAVQTYRLSGR